MKKMMNAYMIYIKKYMQLEFQKKKRESRTEKYLKK